uniref:Uncharacterized protein n=1 Tax=Anguilla anguilla TaxID=7936 RepID=A0A0E9RYD0_ANGAN
MTKIAIGLSCVNKWVISRWSLV